ncbi:MAG: RloB domain-containing protein [Bacteroidetes bacterium]|nr:MAG: RloB domain-containing protein [Bacteroidota bacterium]TAG85231.1 MAG: RloB domain-containing protein [Bacteroidota bacterium]
MPRERKGISKRKSKIKDTRRYFVIASEGADTERIYFEGLAKLIIKNGLDRLIKIEFLVRSGESERAKSAHKDIIKQLDTYKKKYRLDEKDELWLVIDRDKQTNKINTFADTAQKCIQKNYFLALSNPNFELWLLLHLKDLNDYSEEKINTLLENKKVENSHRNALEKELFDLLNEYNKSHYKFEKFESCIPDAIQRAKDLDKNPNERWVENSLGSRVYLLVEKIITP